MKPAKTATESADVLPQERIFDAFDAMQLLVQDAAAVLNVTQLSSDPKQVRAVLEQWLHERHGLPGRQSRVISLFDLLVTRFAQLGRVAFESSEGSTTYEDLQSSTAELARMWLAQGVTGGSSVALCRSFGQKFVVELLTSFRLGACATWIPPLGEAVERQMLGALQPDFLSGRPIGDAVAAAPGATALQAAVPRVPLTAEQVRDRGFERTAPCLQVFSPLACDDGELSFAPRVISAEDLLTALGRDASFCWVLRAGDRVAAPGFDDLRHQPALLLSCLSVGACYHHVGLDALERSGLAKVRLRALGLNRRSREALRRGAGRPEVDHWFREFDEPDDGRWANFSKQTLPGTPHAAVACDPALGGVVLAELRSVVSHGRTTLPMPGLSFEFSPLDGSSPQSPIALLQVEGASGHDTLVNRLPDGLGVLGSVTPLRRGRVFPRGIIVELLESLEGVIGAAVLELPSGSAAGDWHFGAVVFVQPRARGWTAAGASRVQRGLERFMAQVLAPELRPDFVECHPLAPVRDANGQVDAAWVVAQRASGALRRREEKELFRALGACAAVVQLRGQA